jgi:hypothetical protein
VGGVVIRFIIAAIFMLAALVGCRPAPVSGIRQCPGHPKATALSDRSPHICHLGDTLGNWKAQEWEKIRRGW